MVSLQSGWVERSFQPDCGRVSQTGQGFESIKSGASGCRKVDVCTVRFDLRVELLYCRTKARVPCRAAVACCSGARCLVGFAPVIHVAHRSLHSTRMENGMTAFAEQTDL